MDGFDKKDYYIKLWEQNRFLNSGCCTPIYAIVLIGIVMFLSSCATKGKLVDEKKERTEVRVDSIDKKVIGIDSIDNFHKSDKTEKEVVNRETKVEKSDSTVMTVDVNGNVIKQETWHKEKETISRNREYEKCLHDSIAQFKQERDSLIQYVARCDSLQEKLSHKEYVTVEKQKIPKFCYASLVFSFVCIIFAIIKLFKWLRVK